jgi:transposase
MRTDDVLLFGRLAVDVAAERLGVSRSTVKRWRRRVTLEHTPVIR